MLLGIPITPPFYYLMSMPVAQTELMAIDQSIVVYPKTDKVEMAGGKSRTFARPEQESLDEANDHWERLLRGHKAGKAAETPNQT